MQFKSLFVLATAVLCSSSFAMDFHDFENATATSGATFTPNFPGTLTTFTLAGACSNLIIRRQAAVGALGSFDIHDHVGWGPFPPSWGNRSLSPFNDMQGGPFWIEFTSPVTGFSLEFGDFGGDLDLGQIWAYDGIDNTSTLVDTDNFNYAGGAFPANIGFLSVSAPSIRSVYFIGGDSSFPNSVYYDNFRVECVPEPLTIGALGLGVAALLRRRKARS